MTLQHGAIAQLGERYAGSVEVRGSSPLGSIPLNPYSIRVFLFVRNRAIAQKSNWGQFGDEKFILRKFSCFSPSIRLEEAAFKGGFVVYQFSFGAIFATGAPHSRKNANTAGGEIAKPIVPRNPTTVSHSPFSMAF